MAFDTQVPRHDYVGNSTTATYSFGFRIFEASDLLVTKVVVATGVETALVYLTDFTLPADAVNNPNGSSLTLTAGNLPTGTNLTIRFSRTPKQSSDLRNQAGFFPETHEDKFDELTRYVQQLLDEVNRCLQLPETEAGQAITTSLGAVVSRASKFVAFDANGNLTLAAGTSGDLTPVSGFINGLLGNPDAATARATLDASKTEPADNVFRVVGSGDATKKIAFEADQITTGTTRTYTGPDKSGTLLLTSDLSLPNPVTNAEMEVWQRGTTFTGAGSGWTLADRYQINFVTSAVVNVNRSTNVPTVAGAGRLFNYSLEIDVTTADASVAAGDVFAFQQKIEGYNWRPFAQQIVTASFWISSTKTGVHCVSLRNSLPDRSCVMEVTVNAADTWEYKTVTFPASPSAGTWDYTTGIGAYLTFCLMSGSTFQTTPGSWQTGNFIASSNQVNVLDSTANFFRITGIKLEVGSVATPLAYVPFEVELARCMRYYQKSFHYATAPAQNVGSQTGESRFPAVAAGAVSQLSGSIMLPVPMRSTTPTITLFNPVAANAQVRNFTDNADHTASVGSTNGDKQILITHTGLAGTAIGESLGVHWEANAEL